jgi:ABC-type sugar transport system permease subunit
VLSPAIVWFVIYMICPLLMVLYYSFTNSHMAYDTYKFVGFDQYVKMFTADPIFLTGLKNTVVGALMIVPSTVILSLLLAVGLNAMSNRIRSLFTFIYFMPAIISMAAISLVGKWIYNPSYGLVNTLLDFFGLPAQPLINGSEQALACIAIIQVWAIFGYYSVVLLASIRGIDKSLYEAADIDGASAFKKLLHVTLPGVRNTLLFVGIMATTEAFMIFTPIQIITNGTPGSSTVVMMLHIINRGIKNSDTGYATAMSIVLMLMILGVSLVQWFLIREGKVRSKHSLRLANTEA